MQHVIEDIITKHYLLMERKLREYSDRHGEPERVVLRQKDPSHTGNGLLFPECMCCSRRTPVSSFVFVQNTTNTKWVDLIEVYPPADWICEQCTKDMEAPF